MCLYLDIVITLYEKVRLVTTAQKRRYLFIPLLRRILDRCEVYLLASYSSASFRSRTLHARRQGFGGTIFHPVLMAGGSTPLMIGP